jgi:hypothetical protein
MSLLCVRASLFFILATPCWALDDFQTEYQKQLDKLKQASNPVAKVKTLIKMSRIDLKAAASQVKKGDLSTADTFLERYVGTILQAQEVLKSSGRNAQKNPAGFRELEISLNDQLRRMKDIRDGYPFDQQEKIEKAVQTGKAVQEEMLRAIFGPENLRQPNKDGKNKPRKTP